MKKFIFLLIGLLVSTSVNADDLDNILNKVYNDDYKKKKKKVKFIIKKQKKKKKN